MAKYPLPLIHLMSLLKKLPGVGSKTAERFAFQLLDWPGEELSHLSELTRTLKETIVHCDTCRCIKDQNDCAFCDETKRDTSVLCIISSAKDAYAFEETRTYKGLYHVLGGLLSPLDGKTPEHLDLPRLKKRLESHGIQEVILALDSTIEGDATALFLKDELQRLGVRVTRLAFGLPIGSPLEYIDGSTLSRALSGRQSF
ncbi:MAG: recombination protein RecR [Verrucomicrobia bacterium]|nr:recombination protein RecR [Verrucomicrobiota bacterium]